MTLSRYLGAAAAGRAGAVQLGADDRRLGLAGAGLRRRRNVAGATASV